MPPRPLLLGGLVGLDGGTPAVGEASVMLLLARQVQRGGGERRSAWTPYESDEQFRCPMDSAAVVLAQAISWRCLYYRSLPGAKSQWHYIDRSAAPKRLPLTRPVLRSLSLDLRPSCWSAGSIRIAGHIQTRISTTSQD